MPVTHDILLESGETVKITFPEPRQGMSTFVIAGHKTGSVLLNNIIRDFARLTPLPTVAVEEDIWRQGVSIRNWPQQIFDLMDQEGYIFHSFRDLQRLPEIKSFDRACKIFMVRDPRDVAVSYFFSMAKSHTLPAAGQVRDEILKIRELANELTVDEFVQSGKANHALANIQRFADFLGQDNAVFYRYEDIIFEKAAWVRQIASDLKIEITEDDVHKIAKRHDIRPEKEDPSAHIRSVSPGDYKNKLAPESVRYIEKTFPRFFSDLKYPATL